MVRLTTFVFPLALLGAALVQVRVVQGYDGDNSAQGQQPPVGTGGGDSTRQASSTNTDFAATLGPNGIPPGSMYPPAGMQTFATGLNGTPKGRIPPVDQQFGERRSSPQPAAHHQYGSNSMPALGKAINDQFTKERESRLKGMLKWGTVPALVAGFFSGGLLAPVAGLITGGYGWHRRVERNRKVFRKILSKYDQLYPQLKTLSDKQIDKAISDGEKFWNNQKNFVPEQSWKQRIQSKLGLGSSQQPQAQELRGESDVQADLTTTATNPGNEVSTMDKFKNYFSRLGNAVINRDPNNPGTAPVPQNP